MALVDIYHQLLEYFGKQNWWPGKGFEMAAGAILTQQTSWKNVEEALNNLQSIKALDPRIISTMPLEQLESLIRCTGFYKQKAQRLKNFSRYLLSRYNGNLSLLLHKLTVDARSELLSLEGIGPETADSILLYEGNKLLFVVDAYTKRFLKRFGFPIGESYEEIRIYMESHLPRDIELYKEFHALIVELGKNYCRTKPLCEKCPLRNECKQLI